MANVDFDWLIVIPSSSVDWPGRLLMTSMRRLQPLLSWAACRAPCFVSLATVQMLSSQLIGGRLRRLLPSTLATSIVYTLLAKIKLPPRLYNMFRIKTILKQSNHCTNKLVSHFCITALQSMHYLKSFFLVSD